jgi:hypothetical protein
MVPVISFHHLQNNVLKAVTGQETKTIAAEESL